MTTTERPTDGSAVSASFWSYLKNKDVDYFPRNKLRWWLLSLIILAWTVQNFEAFKAGPVLPYIFTDFHTNLTVWGYLSAGAGVATAAGGLYMGILADKMGRRPIIVWPVLGYGLIMVLGAIAPNLGIFALTLFLGALVVAGMSPAVTAACRDLSPQSGRATTFGWLGFAYTIGALLSTWVAHFTIPIWPGFRAQYWIGAVMAGVVLIILMIFYRDLSPRIRGQILHDQAEAMQAQAHDLGYSTLEEANKTGNLIFKDWRMWVLNSVVIFWGVAYVTVGSYVPLYITEYDGVSTASSAGLASMFWLTFTVALVFSGWLCDKLRVRKIVGTIGGIATGIMFLVIALLPKGTHNIGELSLIWAITGICAGFIYPAYTALVSENAEAISPFGVSRAFSLQMPLGLAATLFLNLGLPHVVGNGSGWPAWMVISAVCCILIGSSIAIGGVGPWLSADRGKNKKIKVEGPPVDTVGV
jgi:MFS transporter, ACS family, D-galactonate transporter